MSENIEIEIAYMYKIGDNKKEVAFVVIYHKHDYHFKGFIECPLLI